MMVEMLAEKGRYTATSMSYNITMTLAGGTTAFINF